jgi:hypothetical protein
MNLPIRIALTALAAFAVLSPAAAHAKRQHQNVPTPIQVPAGHKLFEAHHAIGVQIYACNGTAWTFVAPRANLYNEGGKFRMSHFAGPTWMAKDGSYVVAHNAVPHPVAGTIPWLRLQAKSTGAGPYGDKLAKTTYIQRLNTTGGLAPDAATCNTTTAGTQAEVPYTADYLFYREK